MFTGIVTDVGEVLSVEPRAQGLKRLTIGCSYAAETIDIGASIACAGVCLTVVDHGRMAGGCWFAVDAAAETLAVTTVGRWRAGTRVNLERSLKMGDELGGHLVTGHIDGMAEIAAREDLPDMARLTVRVPDHLVRFIAAKGSIALDGASLTVNTVDGNAFSVLVIPHTLQVTTFDTVRPGDLINVEVDLMARYAARLMER
jgi:riboflavin synthase